MKVSLILPTYNNNDCLRDSLQYLKNSGIYERFNLELIVVDDGGDKPDLVNKLCTQHGALYFRHKINRGKGAALKLGVLNATGNYIIFTDSDMPFSFEDIESFIRLILTNDFDLIVGDRSQNKFKNKNMSLMRFLGSRLFNVISAKFLHLNDLDSQCGLKAFKRDSAFQIFQNTITDRFSIDAEILYRAIKLNLKIKSVNVDLRQNGLSSISLFRDGAVMLFDLIRIRIGSLQSFKFFSAQKNIQIICDDFGMNNSSDRAIIELGIDKVISGCSILVTHDYVKNYKELSKLTNVKCGLHLNLTEGRPISDKNLIPSLVKSDGKFYPFPSFMLRLYSGKILKQHLKIEISHQLNEMIKQNIEINHVDGHQHIHYYSRVLVPLQEVMEANEIAAKRIRFGYYWGGLLNFRTYFISLQVFLNQSKLKFKSTKYLGDFSYLSKKKNLIFKSNTEYMLHVAHPKFKDESFDLTTFNWNERVPQFNKIRNKKEENDHHWI